MIDFFLIFLNFVPLFFAEPFFAIKKVQSRPKYRLRPQPKNLGPDRLRNTDVNLAFFSQEPEPEAAAVLLRHPGLRPVRGHGALLPHDGLPPPLRLLS